MTTTRIVAIGGGHGLSRTLQALRRLDVETTAVVAMADDGGSSGRLRRSFGVPPLGDLRKALASLVADPAVAQLLEHRFDRGDVNGHSLGNLLLLGLVQQHDGDLVAALGRLGGMASARGRVVPSTVDAVELVADGDQGTIRGQATISRSSGHRTVRLEPASPAATPEAVKAIEEAALILLGPGSLFTSILPNLLVPGVHDAIGRSTGQLVLIANLREQPGETSGLDLASHLDILSTHLGRRLDLVLAHQGPPPSGPGRVLGAPEQHPQVERFLGRDLLDGEDGHAPEALAAAVKELLQPPEANAG